MLGTKATGAPKRKQVKRRKKIRGTKRIRRENALPYPRLSDGGSIVSKGGRLGYRIQSRNVSSSFVVVYWSVGGRLSRLSFRSQPSLASSFRRLEIQLCFEPQNWLGHPFCFLTFTQADRGEQKGSA